MRSEVKGHILRCAIDPKTKLKCGKDISNDSGAISDFLGTIKDPRHDKPETQQTIDRQTLNTTNAGHDKHKT